MRRKLRVLNMQMHWLFSDDRPLGNYLAQEKPIARIYVH